MVSLSLSKGGQWPPYVYPYDDVRQLLPNHRMSLVDYRMERYWPREDIVILPVESATASIKRDLEQIIYATLKRRNCTLSLTGGYDSRMLASVVESYKTKIKCFSFKYPTIPRHDVVLPNRIADILQLDYQSINSGSFCQDFIEALDRNTSSMCLDRSRREIVDLGKAVGENFYLQGLLGEQLRGFYYHRGDPTDTDAGSLAKKMLFADNDFIKAGFEDWRKGLPHSNVHILDLLYWECRVGIWAATCTTFKESLVEILPPMNSRRLLEKGLGVELRERAFPHNLFRSIIQSKNPALIKLPFNSTLLERSKRRFSATLPLSWGIKRQLGLI